MYTEGGDTEGGDTEGRERGVGGERDLREGLRKKGRGR